MPIEKEQKWMVIINPKSGEKRYRHQRKYLFHTLKKAGVLFDYRVTKYAGHAEKIVRILARQGYKNYLILGGDGTVNEFINGLFGSGIKRTDDIKIAIIPRGTGNDWARFWGLTRDYKHSIDVFLKGNIQAIDVGRVVYDFEGKRERKYFINSLGLGVDSAVTDLTNRMKKYFGSYSIFYSIATIIAVFSYKPQKITIETNRRRFKAKLFTMSIANACYSGGGIKQVPHAVPYDGVFDIMVARKPSFFEVLSGLHYLFRGKILEHPVVKTVSTERITLRSEKRIFFETDGVLLQGGPVLKVKILPASLLMVVP